MKIQDKLQKIRDLCREIQNKQGKVVVYISMINTLKINGEEKKLESAEAVLKYLEEMNEKR